VEARSARRPRHRAAARTAPSAARTRWPRSQRADDAPRAGRSYRSSASPGLGSRGCRRAARGPAPARLVVAGPLHAMTSIGLRRGRSSSGGSSASAAWRPPIRPAPHHRDPARHRTRRRALIRGARLRGAAHMAGARTSADPRPRVHGTPGPRRCVALSLP
jgi:hypothetical protein